jgi:PIN domain nuclease of toxin-antitoxin system
MKILLDTHFLLWAATDKLPANALKFFTDERNTLFFSSASIWEIVIKRSLGREDFIVDPELLYNGLLSAGYKELTITSLQALYLLKLPILHKDPFDRILLAQAKVENIPLLTSDDTLEQYPDLVIYLKR